MADTPHVGDLLTVRVAVTESGASLDISAATLKQIKFRKPDGTVVTKTATTVGGEPSKIEYTFAADELDQAGYWKAQPYLEGIDGWSGHGAKTVEFEVRGVL